MLIELDLITGMSVGVEYMGQDEEGVHGLLVSLFIINIYIFW